MFDDKWVKYCYNDEYRYDRRLDAICTSISFPNYKMFYHLISDSDSAWAIIGINTNFIYQQKCVSHKRLMEC